MIFVNDYAIRPPIPKTIFVKHCRVEMVAFPFVLVFSISTAFSVSDSRLHICSNSSSCHNVFILLSLSGVTNLSLLAGVCAACMMAYRCLQMKWWAAVTVATIPSQKALLMCPYVSSGKFSVLAKRCSRALLHNLQPTSDCCLILASHLFGYQKDACNCHHLSLFDFGKPFMWLPEGCLQLPSLVAFYVSKGRTGR